MGFSGSAMAVTRTTRLCPAERCGRGSDPRMTSMTPEEVGDRLVALLATDDPDTGAVTAEVSGGGPGHARAVVDVPVARWWFAAEAARDAGALGCDFFDWLS